MPIGTVKSWNDLRGFGFIQPDGDGPDSFVHAKNLDGCSELVPGQRVEYEPTSISPAESGAPSTAA